MAQRHSSSTPSALSLPSDREIRIDRVFNAPRLLVWRAWTDAAMLPRWMGPKAYNMTRSEMDVRPGGAYHWTWDVPPKGMSIHGTFVEVDAPRRLVTDEYMDGFRDPSRNTITFTEKDGRTAVSVLVKVANREVRDAMLATGMQNGMDQGYGRLDSLLKESQ